MLSDPLNIPAPAILSGETEVSTPMQPFHPISVGPGARVSRVFRKPDNFDVFPAPALGGTVTGLTNTTSHDIVKGGRRRSLMRFDLTIRHNVTGELSEGAAYFVLDRDPKGPFADEMARILLAQLLGFLAGDATLGQLQFENSDDVSAFIAGEP